MDIHTNVFTSKSLSYQRFHGLDLLRGIAILLVLLHHHSKFPPCIPAFGWIGVDLFFALSGFLVAGLLFADFKKNDTINVRSFAIRRGLKILPPFFCLIFVTICIEIIKQFAVPGQWGNLLQRVTSELLFLQSCQGGLFVHTWSLAVEVHFYVLILFVSYAGLRFIPLQFEKYFPFLVVLIMIVCLILRVNNSLHNKFEFWSMVTPTHLRIDGLWLGSLIAYFYYFKNEPLSCYMQKNKMMLSLISISLFSAFILYHNNIFFRYTIGLSFLSVGFCIVVLLMIFYKNNVKFYNNSILRVLSVLIGFIGIHSYSIYLWHMFVIKYLFGFLIHRNLLAGFSLELEFSLYFLACIFIGILMSKLVEMPMLKLRNKWITS